MFLAGDLRSAEVQRDGQILHRRVDRRVRRAVRGGVDRDPAGEVQGVFDRVEVGAAHAGQEVRVLAGHLHAVHPELIGDLRVGDLPARRDVDRGAVLVRGGVSEMVALRVAVTAAVDDIRVVGDPDALSRGEVDRARGAAAVDASCKDGIIVRAGGVDDGVVFPFLARRVGADLDHAAIVMGGVARDIPIDQSFDRRIRVGVGRIDGGGDDRFQIDVPEIDEVGAQPALARFDLHNGLNVRILPVEVDLAAAAGADNAGVGDVVHRQRAAAADMHVTAGGGVDAVAVTGDLRIAVVVQFDIEIGQSAVDRAGDIVQDHRLIDDRVAGQIQGVGRRIEGAAFHSRQVVLVVVRHARAVEPQIVAVDLEGRLLRLDAHRPDVRAVAVDDRVVVVDAAALGRDDLFIVLKVDLFLRVNGVVSALLLLHGRL